MSDSESQDETPVLILASNPERLSFSLGEAIGGGPADGMELCVMTVEPWTNCEGKYIPEQRIVFSRHSADLTIKALVSYLVRTEEDIETDRRAKEEENNE